LLLSQGDPLEQGDKREATSLNFTVIGLSSVKMVADRHRYAAYQTSSGDKLLWDGHIADLE